MNKSILVLLIASSLNYTAKATSLNTATTEEPKKTEEAALLTKDQQKKMAFEDKRNDLKMKHKKKKAAIAAKASTVVSTDLSQANSDVLKDVKRENKIQEHKEDNSPKK